MEGPTMAALMKTFTVEQFAIWGRQGGKQSAGNLSKRERSERTRKGWLKRKRPRAPRGTNGR